MKAKWAKKLLNLGRWITIEKFDVHIYFLKFYSINFAIHINTDIRTVGWVTATASANYCGHNSSIITKKKNTTNYNTLKLYTIHQEATRWWVCKARSCFQIDKLGKIAVQKQCTTSSVKKRRDIFFRSLFSHATWFVVVLHPCHAPQINILRPKFKEKLGYRASIKIFFANKKYYPCLLVTHSPLWVTVASCLRLEKATGQCHDNMPPKKVDVTQKSQVQRSWPTREKYFSIFIIPYFLE